MSYKSLKGLESQLVNQKCCVYKPFATVCSSLPPPIAVSSYNPVRKLNVDTCVIENISSKAPAINMQWKETKYPNLVNPNVWGPAFWFSLHNGAINMPTKLDTQRVQGLIHGLPEILPCVECRIHAKKFINDNSDRINAITQRTELFEFLVDFHNYVNTKQEKATMSYKDAWAMYSQGANVNVLTYE